MAEVTVGEICKSCLQFAMQTCPYKNHLKTQTTSFQGDIRGKCTVFQPVEDMSTDVVYDSIYAGSNKMKKTAKEMKDSELNISIYRKIMAMDESERTKIVHYWSYLFPSDYANEMADEENHSKQKKPDQGKKDKRKETTHKKNKENSREKKDKDQSSTTNWFKNVRDKKENSQKNTGKFDDEFGI